MLRFVQRGAASLARYQQCIQYSALATARRSFSAAAASASSSDPLFDVKSWRAGKALVDLQNILTSERESTQQKLYDRFFTEYALYDVAPVSVINFWFANKPASLQRSTLHYNVLLHTKLFRGGATSVDDGLALLARMKAEGVYADEATYQLLMGALGRGGRTAEAAAQFEAMTKAGLLPRVSHYQLLALSFAEQGDLAQAEAWLQRLKTDKEGAGPSRPVVEALLAAYAKADPSGKKFEAKTKPLAEQLATLQAAETAAPDPLEPEGVQWKLPFKPVTSTGGEDKGAAAKGGAKAAPAKKK